MSSPLTVRPHMDMPPGEYNPFPAWGIQIYIFTLIITIMKRVLLLTQRTDFCRFAGRKLSERFRGKVKCETIGSYNDGLRIMEGVGPEERAMLIWGNGMMHQFSNILNMPSSVKYVFDDHNDDDCSKVPEFDSHNTFSRNQGVILRICRRLGREGCYTIYDHREGNGLMHVSVDLDFIMGFPALPWMSTGSNDISCLAGYIASLAGKHKLVRFDIGGYREMHKDEDAMGQVYDRFYRRISEQALGLMADSG